MTCSPNRQMTTSVLTIAWKQRMRGNSSFQREMNFHHNLFQTKFQNDNNQVVTRSGVTGTDCMELYHHTPISNIPSHDECIRRLIPDTRNALALRYPRCYDACLLLHILNFVATRYRGYLKHSSLFNFLFRHRNDQSTSSSVFLELRRPYTWKKG